MGNAVSHGTKRSSLLHVWLMTEVEAYQPVFTVDHNRYLLEPLIEAVAYVFTGPNHVIWRDLISFHPQNDECIEHAW